ncbi:MAG: AAA family ATPase, partial [Saprospiraceae bacterium]|nr:AAA family ATPase [Saprospiraceae bacterium]
MEKTKKGAFITGRAGTGKSTLLRLFRTTTRKKIVVLAPTGVAALNVKGQTIHSFFGFPGRPLSPKDIKKVRNKKMYENLDVIIIDEISMVRADLLDNIDLFLKINRNNPEPFGGVQMIFFGDLFQLPPVVASDAEAMLFNNFYESPYFFSAQVFDHGYTMEMLELHKVYRQENRYFLRLLDAIRTNRIDREDLEELNERYLPDFDLDDHYITLSPRNYKVDQINERKLKDLDTEEEVFFADVKGNFDPRLYPTEQALKLKLGAQVMFIKNDPEKSFVNGTIGKVVEFGTGTVKVEIKEEGKTKVIEVGKLDWEILKYVQGKEDEKSIDTEVIGTFSQIPLRLAWAITIHKSQGKTFERVIIDMGKGAFEHGQTYVALSRCTSLEGI